MSGLAKGHIMKDIDHENYNEIEEHEADRMLAEVDAFCYEARVAAMNFAMHIGKENKFATASDYVKAAAEVYTFLIKDCVVPVDPDETYDASAMGRRN